MNSEKFRCALLDLDGTLLDLQELILGSFEYALRTCLGLQVPREEIRSHFIKRDLHQIMSFYSQEQADNMVLAYRSFTWDNHDRLARPYPGAVETVQSLQAAGVPVAIVSSKRRDLVIRGLELLGLTNQPVVALEDAPAIKPDPAPLHLALELLNHPLEGVLMVGDTPADIISARRAGVSSAAVEWTVLPPEMLAAHKPDYWLKEWADMLTLFGTPALKVPS